MITRKQFIALSSLGTISVFFPDFLFSKPFTLAPKIDVRSMLRDASVLRKNYKLNEAQEIYKKILELDPNEVRAYDGLRMIFLASGDQKGIIDLLTRAVDKNPKNVNIKQRLYREYFNVALGNKKLANELGINGRLLEEVKKQYESFSEGHSNPHNVRRQLEKINNYLEWNVDTTNPHENVPLRKYKKEQYQGFKKRFDNLKDPIPVKLDQLLEKPLDRRGSQVRELYKLTVGYHRKEKKHELALEKAVKFRNTVTKRDPLFLKYVRDLSKTQKKYDLLLSIEKENHALRNTFWSGLALFDAHLKKAEDQHAPIPAEVNSLLQYLNERMESPAKRFEVITRKIKLDIMNGQTEEAKNKILSQCRNMIGSTNSHMIDRINFLIAKYYVKINNTGDKNKIMSIVVNPESFLDSSDSLIQSMALMNLKRAYNSDSHIQNLQKIISQL